jgi:hypothetical protein
MCAMYLGWYLTKVSDEKMLLIWALKLSMLLNLLPSAAVSSTVFLCPSVPEQVWHCPWVSVIPCPLDPPMTLFFLVI